MINIPSLEVLGLQGFYTRIEPRYLVYKFHFGWDYPENIERATEPIFLAPMDQILIKDKLLRAGYPHLYHQEKPCTPEVENLEIEVIPFDVAVIDQQTSNVLKQIAAGEEPELPSRFMTMSAVVVTLEGVQYPSTVALICPEICRTENKEDLGNLLQANGINRKFVDFFWRDNVIFL